MVLLHQCYFHQFGGNSWGYITLCGYRCISSLFTANTAPKWILFKPPRRRRVCDAVSALLLSLSAAEITIFTKMKNLLNQANNKQILFCIMVRASLLSTRNTLLRTKISAEYLWSQCNITYLFLLNYWKCAMQIINNGFQYIEELQDINIWA